MRHNPDKSTTTRRMVASLRVVESSKQLSGGFNRMAVFSTRLIISLLLLPSIPILHFCISFHASFTGSDGLWMGNFISHRSLLATAASATANSTGSHNSGGMVVLSQLIPSSSVERSIGNNDDSSRNPYKVAFVVVAAFSRCKASTRATYSHVLDGYAVLSESIHHHHPDAHLILLAHPSTKKCGMEEKLLPFGYKFLYRDVPVPIDEIQDAQYVHIARYERPGCCGLREFIKLHCYALTDYDVVIHVDIDTLLKKNLKDLIQVMMKGRHPQLKIQSYRNEQADPHGVDFVFTRDYKGGNELHPHDPFRTEIQGGFFMVKPSLVVYDEMKSILRRGNFNSTHGWEGSGIGKFYGDAQIQGFLAYYYYSKNFSRTLEVDRCIYNTVMEDDYLRSDGSCMTNETTCQDCKTTPWSDLVLLHYTMCTKPWTCMLPQYRPGDYQLCKTAHREWFRVRRDLEYKVTGSGAVPATSNITSTALSRNGTDPDYWTYGYCTEYGHLDTKKDSYISLLQF